MGNTCIKVPQTKKITSPMNALDEQKNRDKSTSVFESNILGYPMITDPYSYDDIILHNTLDGYLFENINNYNCLAVYLIEHYACENLLFIRDALIYKKTLINIKKYLETNNITINNINNNNDKNDDIKSDTDNTVDTDDEDEVSTLFTVETNFEYLKDVHKNTGIKLGINYLSNNISSINISELIKFAVNVFNQMYNKYISETAKFPINLPFEISLQLDYTMKHLNKLTYIDDYIYVWDNANREIWKLLSNTYTQHYRPHVRGVISKN